MAKRAFWAMLAGGVAATALAATVALAGPAAAQPVSGQAVSATRRRSGATDKPEVLRAYRQGADPAPAGPDPAERGREHPRFDRLAAGQVAVAEPPATRSCPSC